MEAHLVGNNLTPDPSPKGEGSYETSLSVTQWVELARGERVVQEPANLFRVEMVVREEHYCLFCCDVRSFDAVYPCNPLWKVMKRCRCCGKEVVV